MTTKEKRKIIADIYWALKKDFHQMELQDIYYDVDADTGNKYRTAVNYEVLA